jgi:hypothetical protein
MTFHNRCMRSDANPIPSVSAGAETNFALTDAKFGLKVLQELPFTVHAVVAY